MLTNESVSDPSDESAIESYEQLLREVFPEDDASEPILGVTEDVVVAPNLNALLRDQSATIASLKDDDSVIGLSLAIPIDKMDPARESEARDTAYIYYTAIKPSEQGEGHVGKLMDDLFRQLNQQGYSYVERDCVIANGYADKVQKTYGEAIIENRDHNNYPENGPERFFRIDLNKALEHLT